MEDAPKKKPDIPVWLAIVIIVALVIFGNMYNHYDTKSKNQNSKPFEATVLNEKVLCYNNNCWQEFKAVTKNNEYLLNNDSEPWLVVGSKVKVIEVHEQSICIPGRGGCSNDDSHYKMYRE